jgi:hypothetical protein
MTKLYVNDEITLFDGISAIFRQTGNNRNRNEDKNNQYLA